VFSFSFLVELKCLSGLFHVFAKKQKNIVLLFKQKINLFFFSLLFKTSSLFLFNVLLDIFVTDMLAYTNTKRFFLAYCFVNISKPCRIFLQFCCTEFSSIVSLTSLFYSAN